MENSFFKSADSKEKIRIFANIYDSYGIYYADGIGLFRSEFLFLGSRDFPSEEAQLSAYKKVLIDMHGKPVIIRTMDLCADKNVDYSELDNEENPALGLRGIRLCLSYPDFFKVQLRALYRASVYGNLGIMFPMITSVDELDAIMRISEDVKADLRLCSIPYSDSIQTGIMIETPAAALLSDELAPLVDFFSIGTNDLSQYTIACDRQNARLEPFIDKTHKALMRLIEMSVQSAHKAGIRIGICGELAADTNFTETFIKMGIDYLSVSPQNIPLLRDFIRNLD